MKEYAQAGKLLRQFQRSLITSNKGKKILLGLPLVQWHLVHGLVITEIYRVMQYWLENCLSNLKVYASAH